MLFGSNKKPYTLKRVTVLKILIFKEQYYFSSETSISP